MTVLTPPSELETSSQPIGADPSSARPHMARHCAAVPALVKPAHAVGSPVNWSDHWQLLRDPADQLHGVAGSGVASVPESEVDPPGAVEPPQAPDGMASVMRTAFRKKETRAALLMPSA
jgi:hypothetical protein